MSVIYISYRFSAMSILYRERALQCIMREEVARKYPCHVEGRYMFTHTAGCYRHVQIREVEDREVSFFRHVDDEAAAALARRLDQPLFEKSEEEDREVVDEEAAAALARRLDQPSEDSEEKEEEKDQWVREEFLGF